jgi:hypothetical protein
MASDRWDLTNKLCALNLLPIPSPFASFPIHQPECKFLFVKRSSKRQNLSIFEFLTCQNHVINFRLEMYCGLLRFRQLFWETCRLNLPLLSWRWIPGFFRNDENAGNFLTSCKTVSFERRSLLHGVSNDDARNSIRHWLLRTSLTFWYRSFTFKF